MESAKTAQRRAALDLVIIGVLADGGLRRSEAAALTWGDVELWADGTSRLTVQKGKNQVEPAMVAVTKATARALREIQPGDADPAAPVFGLTGEALANRVRAAAKAAGLDEGFSVRSVRRSSLCNSSSAERSFHARCTATVWKSSKGISRRRMRLYKSAPKPWGMVLPGEISLMPMAMVSPLLTKTRLCKT